MPSLKTILAASTLSLVGLSMIAVPAADARSHSRKAGHSVRAQSRANAKAPGFNPDGAKQTATGGQSGGAVGQE